MVEVVEVKEQDTLVYWKPGEAQAVQGVVVVVVVVVVLKDCFLYCQNT
jgi:hypothetical protein